MITYLNTFAGLGGNTEKLDRSKFNITHVENNKKRLDYLEDNFKQDIVIKADAYQFILDHIMDYDILWASPPCPTHSAIRWGNRRHKGFTYAYPDMQLYGLIFLLQRARKYESWIVENVTPYYEPLIKPTAILGRHLIWSNFNIANKKFGPDNIQNKTKDERDKMNADIGKYIINCINKKQDITLEAFT